MNEETTPRTGIVEVQQYLGQLAIEHGILDTVRPEMDRELGALIAVRIRDGRHYDVVVSEARTQDAWGDFRFTLTATILLRHWQDAQIGEDVVPELFWHTGYDEIKRTVDLETWKFQRITVKGRTLCWRRIA